MTYDIQYIVIQSSSGLDVPAWTAIGISVLALFASIWQARVSRTHNRLSVRPLLEGHSLILDDVYRLEVRNDGLGPAVITDARAFRLNKRLVGEGPQLIKNAFQGIQACQLIAHHFFYTPFVLPAGGSIEIFSVRFNPEIPDIEAYLGDQLYLQIDYESAYKEKCPRYESRRPS